MLRHACGYKLANDAYGIVVTVNYPMSRGPPVNP
jgi:hypothetical protein